MQKKLLVVVMLVVMTMTIAVGCSNNSSKTSEPVQSATTQTITDMFGTEVTIPTDVKTIVNCWPSSNQILITLGATDKQIAYMDILKSDSFTWMQIVNPMITEKPSIGTNSTNTVSAEELLKLEPDLVITAKQADADIYRNAGLTAVAMMFKDYDGLKKSVLLTGQILGGDAATKAKAYVDYLDGNIKLVNDRLADVQDASKPSVYYVDGQAEGAAAGKTAYLTCGTGTIQEDWITIGGGKLATANLFEGMSKTITPEQLLNLDPDYIVVGGLNQASAYKALMTDKNLAGLKAIQNDQVYRIPQGTFQWDRFGTESALQVVWMAKTLYPDKFADVDLKQMTIDFYKTYLGYELSSDYADAILAGKSSPTGE